MPSDVFLGLVTHPASRFPEAAGEGGLIRSLESALVGLGRSVEVAVVAENLWSPEVLVITPAEVRASIDAELAVEGRWRAYVRGAPLGADGRALLTVRRVWRRLKLAPPWRSSGQDADAGVRMVRRLANIELAHMRLMELAVRSDATWAVLLEDDAWVDDVPAFAQHLTSFLDSAEEVGRPQTMNLSESFTPRQLGIEHLLTEEALPGSGWRLFQAARPVTNTVCAVLYHRDFLEQVTATMRDIPLSPVIPIDFKVNEALMRMAKDVLPGACWVVSPAPIAQRSGVPNVLR
ncbi:MAG: hypothetical protein GC156_11810 [Actinomycetales bacterium]|nr:hypothetical protein [Actinomycetales bacterium]